jgi:hypothetical protein
MEHQFLKVTDFSGSMNTEDDPSNLQQNESALLSNIIPYGVGYLKLDRTRFCYSLTHHYAPTVIHSGFCCGYSWKDTNGNIVIPVIYGNNASIAYFTYSKTLVGYSASYSYVAGADTGSSTSTTRKITKNAFVSYNGVLRVGMFGSSYKPITFTNFTLNGTTRTRFGTAETLQNLNVFNEKVQSDTHANQVRGCGVYNAITPMVDTDGTYTGAGTPDYTSHTIGINATLDSSADSSYVATDTVWFGISLEYDFIQESPMSVCGTDAQPHITFGGSDGGKRIVIDLFVSRGTNAEHYAQFDERITAIHIWRRIGTSGNWYRLYKVAITSGTFAAIDDTGTARTWANYSADLFHFAAGLNDLGYTRYDEYVAVTGYTDYIVYSVSSTTCAQVSYNPVVSLNWNIGCVLRNYVIVNAQYYVENGFTYICNRRLFISRPDQPDIFEADSWISIEGGESSEYTAVVPLGMERLLVWDSRYCYVINANSNDPRGWYKESQYNVPIASGNGYATSTYGVFFVSKTGVYLIDNDGVLQEISRPIKSDWTTNIAADTMQIHFDSTYGILFIAGNTAGTGSVYGYQYDVARKAWARWVGPVLLTRNMVQYNCWLGDGYGSGETYALTSLTSDNLLCLSAIATEAVTQLATDYRSPFYDMGVGESQKFGKHLYIQYKSTVAVTCNVYINNGTSATVTSTLALSTTITRAKVDIPYGFKNIQVQLTTAANTGTFELYELLFEYRPQRPK